MSRKCRFILMTSLWEGFSIALLEAMATGLPIIATKVGGITDIITNGKTGILVSPKDYKGLYKAITKLFKNKEEARNLATKGWKTVMDSFTWCNVVTQINNAYRMLISSLART